MIVVPPPPLPPATDTRITRVSRLMDPADVRQSMGAPSLGIDEVVQLLKGGSKVEGVRWF
jgi:hypothetical protein